MRKIAKLLTFSTKQREILQKKLPEIGHVSYESHMRLKHKANKASEEAENGRGISDRKKYCPWVCLVG